MIMVVSYYVITGSGLPISGRIPTKGFHQENLSFTYLFGCFFCNKIPVHFSKRTKTISERVKGISFILLCLLKSPKSAKK